MFGSATIVFREVLEAALIVTILLAATRGLAQRGRWISGGVAAGLLGAVMVAWLADLISSAMDGFGQEIFNATILFTAVGMLAWHNIWMASHARQLTLNLKQVGRQVQEGSLPLYFLAVASGAAVLREGAEVVLFMYGIAAGGDSPLTLLMGGVIGVALGIGVGILLYRGLLKIPASRLFQVTGWLILLLAAGLAASAVGYLMQADVLPYQAPLWDTSAVLDEGSLGGQIAHILLGYQSQPTGFQLLAWTTTLVLILIGMRWAGKTREAQSAAVTVA